MLVVPTYLGSYVTTTTRDLIFSSPEFQLTQQTEFSTCSSDDTPSYSSDMSLASTIHTILDFESCISSSFQCPQTSTQRLSN